MQRGHVSLRKSCELTCKYLDCLFHVWILLCFGLLLHRRSDALVNLQSVSCTVQYVVQQLPECIYTPLNIMFFIVFLGDFSYLLDRMFPINNQLERVVQQS